MRPGEPHAEVVAMRSIHARSALLATVLFAIACSDQRSSLPTEPPLSSSLSAGRTCPSPLELAALTVALFAPGDLLTFARSTQSDISLRMSRGDRSGARKVALAFIDFTLRSYYQGKLRDPNGANPPTTAEAVVRLIDGILCWVGLPPSGLQLATTSSDVTVTTKVTGTGGLTRAAWEVGSFLARVLGPKRLHATHTGLGGLLGPKLSPVTAARVRLSFEVQPSNTGPGDPISPAVQVAYRDAESNTVATEIVNRMHATIRTT